MKNYNKILEAVNRGILLALDDFDDVEQVLNNIKSKQVLNRDYTKEYLDLMEEVVDLGLPSGTLWCKYNLGVNPNQLLTFKDWYGDYYAWGELEPNKAEFSWHNYKYGKDYNKLSKYCNNLKYGLNGFTDNLTKLQPEDDAAYLNKNLYNFKFYIPTKELCEELIHYTSNYWVNNYDPNKLVHNPKDDNGIQGLNGSVFEGKNGNQLFIPATGFCKVYVNGDSSSYYLWSSNLQLGFTDNAYGMCFNGNICICIKYRYLGFAIRPVTNL